MSQDYLDPIERETLQALRLRNAFVAEALCELDRILASRRFKRLRQEAKDFLGYVVAKHLLGRSEQIKELTIAIYVYHEPTDYNPVERTRVRVAAAGLREKLEAYYAGEGQDDPVEIKIPKGSYVPEICGRCISVAVSPFENWNPDGNQAYLCRTLREDLVYRLAQFPRIQARCVQALDSVSDRIGYALRGSLESRDQTLRLNVSLSDLRQARIVWDHLLEGPQDDLLKLSHDLAAALAAVIQSLATSAAMSIPPTKKSDAVPKRPPARSLLPQRRRRAPGL